MVKQISGSDDDMLELDDLFQSSRPDLKDNKEI
jgi:hypothetical protein